PPHHHHHHTPRSPPPSPPQLNPAPPAPTPPKQAPALSVPPASAPPPTPTPTPTTPIPTPTTPPSAPTSTSPATPTPDAYPFTNYPFFPAATPPPPLPEQPSPDASRTFPANITNLVAPNSPAPSGPPRRFPLFQALLLAFLSLFLLLLSVLLSVLLFRRIRPAANGPAPSHSAASSTRRDGHDDDAEEGDDDEGRSLKPPPMPTSSTNPSTEFLYLGTLASSATPPPPSTHLRPGSPELRPLPPLPRTGPPSGEFFAPRAAANPSSSSSSSSWLSPSSPSASSPTLGSSPAHVARPPSIQQPRGRAPNPSPPKRRPSPPPSPPHHSWNPFAPAPPPPRAAPSSSDDGGESYTTEMRKSRPLHSDKLKPGSLHMKDEMIQLYLNNSAAAREVCLLGAPRCRGIGMVLAALGVSQEQVRDALLEGNAHGLGLEALQMLTQLVPTNDEELKLRYFKDDPPAKLCKVDAFLKTILDVPFAFKRVDAMLYVSNFYLEVNQLRMSYATLEAACQELRSSRLFHRVLGAVLNFGNLMSINTGSPNSRALEPNTLLKIVDVKGADGKAALLHFVVQEIVKPEGHNSLNMMHSAGSAACKTNVGTLPYDVDCRKHGLQVVATLAVELTSTKKAASIDVTSLSRTVSELGAGLGKIHDVLRLNSMAASAESARRFHGAMGAFLQQAEEAILELQAQESVCLSSVKEMAEYFHGDGSASGDEARMFRIFASVREFVAMLDRICREAGEINDGGRVGSTQTASWMAAAPMGMTMATP
ncbi:formin-like protein 14, partial [Lolium rigidum]|uniref:formin-like protein 14 n=1 Tax=Lolium rigidum TaxID=89674 RepID=UPI001F5E30D6